MKSRKLKYTLIAVLCALVAVSTAFIVIFTASAQRKLAVNYFDTFGMTVSEASSIPSDANAKDARAGLILTGSEGAYAKADKVSGEYVIELRSFVSQGNSGSSKITFTDSDGQSFSFVLNATDANPLSVYVSCNGKTAGIYYFSYWGIYSGAKPIGITSGKNASGVYTELYGNDAVTVRFNPVTMCVYAQNESGSERLVWDFTNEYNDGATVNKTFSPFKEYSVSIEHCPDEKDMTINTIVYSVNGTSFRNTVLGEDKSYTFFTLPEYEGLVNEEYTIPAPYVYGVSSGKVNPQDVFVSVAKNGTTILSKTAYDRGLSFLPTESGEYTVSYYYGDGEYQTNVAVQNRFDKAVYSFDFIPEDSYVKGQTISLPSLISVDSDRLLDNRGVVASLTVSKDGVPVSEMANLDAFKAYELTLDAGEYVLSYNVTSPVELGSKIFSFNSTKDGAYLKGGKLSANYGYGDTLTVPTAEIVCGDTVVNAWYKLIYPSGACYTNESSLLSEMGNYTLVYYGVVNGKTYSFDRPFKVAASVEDMFTVNKSNVYSGSATLNNGIKGLVVEANSGNSLVYNNIIDLSDNTEDDLLLELIADPYRLGLRDFDQMRITLTDAHNPDNVVTILFHATIGIASRNCAGTIVYVRAGYSGQTLKGYDVVKEEVITDSNFGYTCPMSLDAMFYKLRAEDQTFKLYYDNEKKAIYSSVSWQENEDKNGKKYERLVADLDDYRFFESPWQGFTTGEVILSIVAEKITGVNARYVIMNIDGNDLGGEVVVDKKAPEISVNEADEVALGKVGVPYQVPTATAKDDFTKNLSLSTRVFYEVDSFNVEVDIVDGKFTPFREGEYSIVYSATDNAGNVGEAIIKVDAYKTLDDISLDVQDEIYEASVGYKVKLGKFIASGGADKYVIKTSVTFGGKSYDVIDGEFLPDVAGEYTVKGEVTDYLGYKAENSYIITVSATLKPILKTATNTPTAFINGFDYTLSAPVALDYNQMVDGAPKEVVASIKAVYGVNGEEVITDGRFTPDVSKGATVDIVYTFDGINEDLVIVETKEVLNPFGQDDSVDFKKYFITENIDAVIENETDVSFKFSHSSSISFANAVQSKQLSLGLGVGLADYLFNSFTVKISDAIDSSVYVTLKINKEAGQKYSTLIINDKISYKYLSPFEENVSGYTFNYSNENRIVSGLNGVKFMKISEDANGKAFSGFSDKVYVSISFEGVSGTSEFLVKNINRQNFASIGTDLGSPSIDVLGDYGGRCLVGDEIFVPKAVAYDVLSKVGQVKVSVINNQTGEYVTDKNGVLMKDLTADKEYSFSVSVKGVFKISYKVTDAFLNESESYKLVRVGKEYEFTGDTASKVPRSAKVGKTITFPEFVPVNIEGEYTVQVIVVSPDDMMHSVVDNSFTFTVEGEWIVRYLVYDSDFNYIMVDYTIKVS